MDRAKQLAWIATIVAAASALAPIIPIVKQKHYNATLVVLTLTLVSIIWYTYFAQQVVAYQRHRDGQERNLAKNTIGASLLAELQWLEDVLYQIYTNGPGIRYDMLGHPVLDILLRRSELFSPTVAGFATSLRILVEDVRCGSSEYSAAAGEQSSLLPDSRASRDNFGHFIQAKAGFAIQAISPLVEALAQDGIAVTSRIPQEALPADQLPPVPASPFGRRTPHEH